LLGRENKLKEDTRIGQLFFFFPRLWLIRVIKLFHGVAVEVSHLAIFFKKNAWSLGFLASIKSD